MGLCDVTATSNLSWWEAGQRAESSWFEEGLLLGIYPREVGAYVHIRHNKDVRNGVSQSSPKLETSQMVIDIGWTGKLLVYSCRSTTTTTTKEWILTS